MRSRVVAGVIAVVACCLEPAPAVAAQALPSYDHVVLVVEENHAASSILGNKAAPFINSLAAGGALMTQSYGVAHPSQPNYLALFAGDTFGVDSNTCPLNFGDAPNLASELFAAGRNFGGFAEGLQDARDCKSGAYVRKHVPWLNFTNVPPQASMPLSAFGQGAQGELPPELPTVSFVVPNLDNDMHDGSIATADSWLAGHLGGYAQWAKANNSLLIVTWDEDDDSADNRIATILYGAGVRPGSYDQRIDHYSVLSTIEGIFGLPKTGRAAGAEPITGVWTT